MDILCPNPGICLIPHSTFSVSRNPFIYYTVCLIVCSEDPAWLTVQTGPNGINKRVTVHWKSGTWNKTNASIAIITLPFLICFCLTYVCTNTWKWWWAKKCTRNGYPTSPPCVCTDVLFLSEAVANDILNKKNVYKKIITYQHTPLRLYVTRMMLMHM